MKPPTAFGAYTAREVLPKIIAQGAWCRCLACEEVASQRRLSCQPEDAGAGTATTSTCSVAEDGLLCTACNKVRPTDYFSTSAIKNQDRNKTRVCNVCQDCRRCEKCEKWKELSSFRPGTTHCRSCEQVWCARCGKTQDQAAFYKDCVKHYFSHKQNVACIACRSAQQQPRFATYVKQTPVQTTCEKCEKDGPRILHLGHSKLQKVYF